MNWGYYIMIAIVVAIIGVIGTLLVGIFNDVKGYKKLSSKVGNTDNGTLSAQHDRLESNIKEFIKANDDILGNSINRSVEKVEKINDEIMRKDIEQEYQYKNLNEKQKEIAHNVKGIEELARDWKSVITENKELKNKLVELEVEYKKVLNENQKLRRKYIHHENDQGLEL